MVVSAIIVITTWIKPSPGHWKFIDVSAITILESPIKETLAIIIPVYNECDVIEHVLMKWTRAIDKLTSDYRIHVYDDGSRDKTLEILQGLSKQNDRLVVHSKDNSGHGPTILTGYRDNADSAWVFQIDSDDEMQPGSFSELWYQRDEYDFLIGTRVQRSQPVIRKLISFISRRTVHLLYGNGVWDVNSPFRLIRGSVLADYVDLIPGDTFAPNVILSGLMSMNKHRIYETTVPHTVRKTGEVSIRKFKLLKVSARSFMQTIKFRFTLP